MDLELDNIEEYSGIGSLQIIVYGQNIGNPLSGALVRITGLDNTIIHQSLTNDEGKTNIINFETPAITFSIESTSTKPYATCNINVSKNGNNTIYVNQIQIFPDATAIQTIFLNAMALNQIDIKPHTLTWKFPTKIPEEAVKSLQMFSGLVVLPDVVVPEYIIVHDGEPNDSSAPNYRVAFKEYVKNVTSCEIYPNWPKETIKANVLAIISFTLNRIYTEWYRAMGHAFTITSTTSHDQAFDYGRNTFKEVSSIVDEVFTQYVTKPEIRQPLLTQYCDGKVSICPDWMSQWGSKDLGDKGHNYLYILKHYYGNNIYIDQARKVENIPYSFRANLSLGSNNADVKVIQEQLNAIANNYPKIEKLKVDGVFGEKTQAVIETFQEVFQLPVTGVVNMATWYKISEIYVAVTKMVQ